MGKQERQAPIHSWDSDDELDLDLSNLAKKRYNKRQLSRSDSEISKKQKTSSVYSDSDSDDKESGSEHKIAKISDYRPSEEDFNDGYDEQMIGDEEDRAYLSSLTEREREAELFNRFQKREDMKIKFALQNKLRQAWKNELAKIKPSKNHNVKTIGKTKEEPPKNSYIDTDSGDSIRYKESSKERRRNNKDNDKRSNAIAELKAVRDNKQKREEAEPKIKEPKRKNNEEEIKCEKKKLKVPAIYSDDSDSDCNTKKSGNELKPSPSSIPSMSSTSSCSSFYNNEEVKKQAAIPTIDDINSIRLSRHKLERFVHMPFFDKLVKGCFVKIGIGQNSGQSVYRCAEVIGVHETVKVYALGNTRTNKGLRVRLGNQDRIFRLEFISNQLISNAEYFTWVEDTTAVGKTFPSKIHFDQKKVDIREAMDYKLNDEDIDKIIREKRRFQKNPDNYAMKKLELRNEKEFALARGDEETAKQLSKKINDIDERAAYLDKVRTSTLSNISYINDRIRKSNIEAAEKALMEEKKSNKGPNVSDPFTRHATRPIMIFKRQAFTLQEPTVYVPENTPGPIEKPAQTSHDDMFSAHDGINIDIELPTALPPTPMFVIPKPQNNGTATRKTLSFEDYKKRKGLF